MRAIKIRSGGTAYVMSHGETCPAGEVCFLQEEWELALKMSKAASTDPDNLQTFWKNLLENKRTIPGFTLLADLNRKPEPPKQEKLDLEGLGIRRREPERRPVSEVGLRICQEILADLKERNERNAK